MPFTHCMIFFLSFFACFNSLSSPFALLSCMRGSCLEEILILFVFTFLNSCFFDLTWLFFFSLQFDMTCLKYLVLISWLFLKKGFCLTVSLSFLKKNNTYTFVISALCKRFPYLACDAVCLLFIIFIVYNREWQTWTANSIGEKNVLWHFSILFHHFLFNIHFVQNSRGIVKKLIDRSDR